MGDEIRCKGGGFALSGEIDYLNGCKGFQLSRPTSVSELLSELMGEMGDPEECYVWRGQRCFSWKPFPGLYRRLQKSYADEQIDEQLVREYENDLLAEANGLGYIDSCGGSRLEFMIQLQHFGGATRLLDVTRDPFVALFFALGDDKCDGVVYRYAIHRSCYASPETVNEWYDVVDASNAGRPLLFSPKGVNERIKAQSAAFLTSVLDASLSEASVFTNVTKDSSVKPVLIARELKRDLKAYLQTSRGIRYHDLFPDFEGFAHANGQNEPFPRAYEQLYGKGRIWPYKPSYQDIRREQG